jgi:hypothetical protein
MLGRIYLFILGSIGLLLTLFLGYNLVYKYTSFSPQSVFNNKDKKVYIFNRISEVNNSLSEYKFPRKIDFFATKLLANNAFNERVFVSGNRNRVLVEASQPWSKDLLAYYLKRKNIKFLQLDNEGVLEDGVHYVISGNYLLFHVGEFNNELHDQAEWPQWDRLAAANMLTFSTKLTKDIYYNRDGSIAFSSKKQLHQKGEKVNDYELFANVIPIEINEYHFYEKKWAISNKIIAQKDIISDWMDNGFVQVTYESTPVIFSDFTLQNDPFEVLNQETEEEEVISGIKKHYVGIQLFKGFPKNLTEGFYIETIGDKVVISERQEVVRKMVEYYEMGKTISKSRSATSKYFENLPQTISERYINPSKAITKSLVKNKLIETVKSTNLTIENQVDNSQEVGFSETFSIEGSFNSFCTNDGVVFTLTDRYVYAIKNNEVLWKNEIQGGITSKLIYLNELDSEKEGVFFSTENKVYMFDLEGKSITGFPVEISNNGATSFCNLRGSNAIYFVSASNELVKLSLSGKIEKKLKLKFQDTPTQMYFLKKGGKNYAVIRDKGQAQVVDLSKWKFSNAIAAIPENSVLVTTANEPSMFYFNDNELVRNTTTGKLKRLGKFENPHSISSLNGNSRTFVSFLTQNSFVMTNEEGVVIHKFKIPTKNEVSYSTMRLEDGKIYVAFLDEDSNDLFITDINGKKINQKPLEGKDGVLLSGSKDQLTVTTLGSNYIIQYKL